MSEQQAVAQAEAMAEAFGDLADTLVTKEYFHAVLDKELGELRSTLRLHSWILGVLVVTNLIPLLKNSG